MLSVDRPAVRDLAGVLAGLFERDRELVVLLNQAQRRLLDAQLGLSAGDVRADVRLAFFEYCDVAERRRQLAADIGEATVPLIAAMQTVGFSAQQARHADVWALRNGIYQEGAER